MSFAQRLFTALLLALTAACAGPLSPVLVDQQSAQLPATTAPLVAESTTAPLATAVPTAEGAPLPLAAHLPLAGWDANGQALSLLPVDPLTGVALAGAGWTDLGASYYSAFAPDGRTLALLIFSEVQDSGGVIHFLDLPTWTMAPATIPVASYPMLMQFSADSRSLLVAGTDAELHDLARYAVDTGAEQARVTLPFAPRSAGFAPGGAQLFLYGVDASQRTDSLNPVTYVARLDLATLTAQWTAALPAVRDGQYARPEEIGTVDLWALGQWYSPAVVWAADGARLYLAHADADQLTTVDFAAEAVTTVAVAPAQTWLDRLLALTAEVAEAKMLNGTTKQGVLGPDGRLYVLGFTVHTVDEYLETPLGLQVIDPASGALLATADTAARNLSLGADAAGAPVLLLEGWGDRYWTEVRALADPHTVLAEFRNRSLVAGRLPSGAPVLLAREDRATRTVFHLIDSATWAEVAQWPAEGFATPLLLP